MNSTTDERIVTESEVGLDEPRFDEEETLLAAQPVVPLVEVKAKTRSKARLSVALAIVGGLLIGLLAATLIYHYLGDNEPRDLETTAVIEQTKTDDELNSAGGSTGSADENAPISTEKNAAVTTEEEKSPIVTPQDTTQATRKPKIAVESETGPQQAPKSRSVIARDSSDTADDDDEIDRDARRADRQEERRERRSAAREARRQTREQAQTTDDLLRIREIFEGTPKP